MIETREESHMHDDEMFSVSELRATEDGHTLSYDGYCSCSYGSTWEHTYSVDHLIAVMKENRAKRLSVPTS